MVLKLAAVLLTSSQSGTHSVVSHPQPWGGQEMTLKATCFFFLCQGISGKRLCSFLLDYQSHCRVQQRVYLTLSIITKFFNTKSMACLLTQFTVFAKTKKVQAKLTPIHFFNIRSENLVVQQLNYLHSQNLLAKYSIDITKRNDHSK